MYFGNNTEIIKGITRHRIVKEKVPPLMIFFVKACQNNKAPSSSLDRE
jgi:hypothetical protein